MCDRWRGSFDLFLEDMGKAPTPAHTLERKNGDLGYIPSNCIWATRKTQANNTRTNISVFYCGVLYTLKQLSEKLGKDYKSLWHYFQTRKLSLEKSIEKATNLGEKRRPGERKFFTADISEVNRRKAIKQWEGGLAAWGR